jgi:hypothetical protein
MKKISLVLILILSLFAISFVSSETGYCCEKTLSGAFCQNAPLEQCDANFKTSPTSCDTTSYCKPGCCFDSQEGLCLESTPQNVCNAGNGTWANSSQCNIPQCNLGCCVLGDQGAFVTLTRCKQLSGFYGLKTDFRSNINNELSCIALASGDDKGACVTEDASTASKSCVFTTRSACKVGTISATLGTNVTNSSQVGVGFYKDILCSAEELGSICGPSKQTTLISGKDEVYYLDTCKNIANIYDASRYNDKQYWKKVYTKSESCGAGESNAGSKTCGNCDYFLGSIGKKATGKLGIGQPTYGNYICADLSCKKEGKQHGESWCVKDEPSGKGQDPVGSRYYKEVCLYGEVITEPCADYRNEICLESDFNGFSEAACRVNRWQDCLQQEEQIDCENIDARDCMWTPGYYFSSNSGQVEKSVNKSQAEEKGIDETPDGLCVPNYPPGSNFWGSTSTTKTTKTTNETATFGGQTPAFGTGYVDPASSGTTGQCSLGNAKLTIKWTKVVKPADWLHLFGSEDWVCDQATGNCQYVSGSEITVEEGSAWAEDMNKICSTLGDCGGKVNWQGVYTEDGFAAYQDQERIAGSGGAKIKEAEKKTTTAATTPTNTNTGSNTQAATQLASLAGGNTGTGAAISTGQVIKDLIKSMVGKA